MQRSFTKQYRLLPGQGFIEYKYFYFYLIFSLQIPLNLDGYPIVVSTALWDPFVNTPAHIPNEKVALMNLEDGIEIQIIRLIAAKINLNITFR